MEEGDLILGTVEEVTNTVTIVKLPDGKKGTIISSEIAPGRIKYMRQYVVPNKKIVCKVLEISRDHIHLSLRRVTSKEKKEVMQKFKQDQAINVAFNQILGEDSPHTNKILKDFESLANFINEIKKDEKIILKYIPKENESAIRKISEKKKKSSELKQNIKLKCLEDDGLNKIKEILKTKNENAKIIYLSAENFRLKLIVEDFKEGKKEMAQILEEFEKNAKKNHCEFSSTEER